jgi:hypothetical protein
MRELALKLLGPIALMWVLVACEGPAGPTGPPGSSADVTELEENVDRLEAKVDSLLALGSLPGRADTLNTEFHAEPSIILDWGLELEAYTWRLVTQKNTGSRIEVQFAYRVTFKNTTDKPMILYVDFLFLDQFGFLLAQANKSLPTLEASETRTVSDNWSFVIEGGTKLANSIAHMEISPYKPAN